MQVFHILAPVFLVIVLGAVLQRTAFVTAEFFREANRVTYWLGLPALLFGSLATSLHEATGAQTMIVVMLISTALVVVAGYIIARFFRVLPTAWGTFVQAAFRGNLAYVGLPIVYTLSEAPGADGLSARATAVLAIAPMLVLYNVLGVGVLLVSQHEMRIAVIKPLTRQLLTTPTLIATLAGIGFALTGWTLPPAIAVSFDWLGQMALPLALLGIGGALMQVRLGTGWQPACAAALVKTALSPAIGYMLGRWLGLGAVELKMVMVFLAAPTAAISYTMASQLQGDEGLASGAILFSTLFSVVSLTAIVFFF